MDEAKKPWQSKTLWTNLALAVTGLFVPTVNAWITSNPQAMVVIFTVINFVLRLVTKKPIGIE